MIEALLLALGLSYQPGVNNIPGTCHVLHSEPVPCLMQEQPFGIRYVTDGQSVYTFRPIFFGGYYDVSKNHEPWRGDTCTVRDSDIICHKTLVFISDK